MLTTAVCSTFSCQSHLLRGCEEKKSMETRHWDVGKKRSIKKRGRNKQKRTINKKEVEESSVIRRFETGKERKKERKKEMKKEGSGWRAKSNRDSVKPSSLIGRPAMARLRPPGPVTSDHDTYMNDGPAVTERHRPASQSVPSPSDIFISSFSLSLSLSLSLVLSIVHSLWLSSGKPNRIQSYKTPYDPFLKSKTRSPLANGRGLVVISSLRSRIRWRLKISLKFIEIGPGKEARSESLEKRDQMRKESIQIKDSKCKNEAHFQPHRRRWRMAIVGSV